MVSSGENFRAHVGKDLPSQPVDDEVTICLLYVFMSYSLLSSVEGEGQMNGPYLEGFVGRENRFPCFLDPHPLSRCDTWIYNICSVQQDSRWH